MFNADLIVRFVFFKNVPLDWFPLLIKFSILTDKHFGSESGLIKDALEPESAKNFFRSLVRIIDSILTSLLLLQPAMF